MSPLEDVRGQDGWLLSLGATVRRVPQEHKVWGNVQGVVGRVTRIYRHQGKPQVLVDFREDGGGSVHTSRPDMLRISQASMPMDELQARMEAGQQS